MPKENSPEEPSGSPGCCYVLLLDLPLHLVEQMVGADILLTA